MANFALENKLKQIGDIFRLDGKFFDEKFLDLFVHDVLTP